MFYLHLILSILDHNNHSLYFLVAFVIFSYISFFKSDRAVTDCTNNESLKTGVSQVVLQFALDHSIVALRASHILIVAVHSMSFQLTLQPKEGASVIPAFPFSLHT